MKRFLIVVFVLFAESKNAVAELARYLDCDIQAQVDGQLQSVGIFSSDVEDGRSPDGSLPHYIAVPRSYNLNEESFEGGLGVLWVLCTDSSLCMKDNYSIKLTHTLKSSRTGKLKKVAQSLGSGVFEATDERIQFELVSGFGSLERVQMGCQIR